MARPERKYVLSKVGPGDYLLPSNDGLTLWRIAKYTEGPSSGLEDWPKDRDVWGIWKYERPLLSLPAEQPVDTEDWSCWEFWEGPHFTRAEAVDRALQLKP